MKKGEIMANQPWSVKCNSCGSRELAPIKPSKNYHCGVCAAQFDIYTTMYKTIGVSVS